MPPKSHGKKHNAQRRPVEKTEATQTSTTGTVESTGATTAAVASSPAVRPSVRQPSNTQPAPRHVYVGRELLRVAIVTVVTIAILVVLSFVLK